jgi:hypothetical protein
MEPGEKLKQNEQDTTKIWQFNLVTLENALWLVQA